MQVICSYCRNNFSEIEPLEDERISHGMCDECFAYYHRQLVGLPLDAYLDGFDSPVLILDKDGRIAAANKEARDRLGKSVREITGLLGGEALECSHARLPEGCGKTVHCETCTIRKIIMHTMQTGETLEKVPVTLIQNGAETEMIFSTYCVDGIVRIVIEK
jgi:PAS domain-containing protein